jgi:hypothetical protein
MRMMHTLNGFLPTHAGTPMRYNKRAQVATAQPAVIVSWEVYNPAAGHRAVLHGSPILLDGTPACTKEPCHPTINNAAGHRAPKTSGMSTIIEYDAQKARAYTLGGRSSVQTLSQAAMKSRTNFSALSSWA